MVSFPSSLVGFLGFHPYMRLFSFRKPFVTLIMVEKNRAIDSPVLAVYTPMYMVWVTFVESDISQR